MRGGPNILVIEDNPANLDLVAYLLRAHGFAPRLAANGADGLRLALDEPPDLILLDLRMSDIDGYEIAASLKPQPSLKDTRIVAVTASAMLDDRSRIADAGFDGYLRKPIDPETFVDDVRRFLPNHPSAVGGRG